MRHSQGLHCGIVGYAGYIETNAEEKMSITDMMKWKRSGDGNFYYLRIKGVDLEKVWKIPHGGYGCLDGNSYPRLKDAKAAAMKRVEGRIIRLLNEIVPNALDTGEDLRLTKGEYVLLSELAVNWMHHAASELRTMLGVAGVSVDRIRDKTGRYGNAEYAFDVDGVMWSILKPAINYRQKTGSNDYVVSPSNLRFTVVGEPLQKNDERAKITFTVPVNPFHGPGMIAAVKFAIHRIQQITEE